MSPAARGTGAGPHAGLRGRPVLVAGLGSFGGGAGAARYLASLGARVTVTDLRTEAELAGSLREIEHLGLATVLGGHRPDDFRAAELVVANPALPPDHPLLELARASGATVRSEIELLLEVLDARVACVTGTQGKSSTVAFTSQLLDACGQRAIAGGNIGGSLLSRLNEIGPSDVVVLELSSYQLEALAEPERLAGVEAVAVVNVLADHLERHGTLERYRAAKTRVLALLREGGTAIVPQSLRIPAGVGPRAFRRIDHAGSCHAPDPLDDEACGLRVAGGRFLLDGEELGSVSDVSLPGAFQLSNVAVALSLGRVLGAAPGDLARALPGLAGLEHRLQDLGWRGGRRIYDNGVSTTPDSTAAAILALEPGVTLLCGGRAKRLSLDPLLGAARGRVARAVTFGEAAGLLAERLREAGVAAVSSDGLEDAVRTALELAGNGRTILFSPACTSFDAFASFRERARAFRSLLPEPEVIAKSEVNDGPRAS